MSLPAPTRTAVIVPTPSADKLVRTWRRSFDPSAAQQVPAHVTLLYPFVAPSAVDEGVLQTLAALFEPLAPRQIPFREIGVRDSLLYLCPDDRGWFAELTAALVTRFPGYPPYGGKYGEVLPHLTVAWCPPDGPDPRPFFGEIRKALEPGLPVVEEVDRVWLSVLRADRWEVLEEFRLGGVGAPGPGTG